MSRFIEHTHEPVYRVVRANWADPLDAGFSRRGEGGRWNTPEFPALYCCCSPGVARAVAMDIFRLAGVELSDLVPDARPQLVEIGWSGGVSDMASANGIDSAGFPAGYPEGASSGQTRTRGRRMARDGRRGRRRAQRIPGADGHAGMGRRALALERTDDLHRHLPAPPRAGPPPRGPGLAVGAR